MNLKNDKEDLNSKISKLIVYFKFKKKFQGCFTSLDVIHTAVYYASNRRTGKDMESLALVETAIYCATIDQNNKVLEVHTIPPF